MVYNQYVCHTTGFGNLPSPDLCITPPARHPPPPHNQTEAPAKSNLTRGFSTLPIGLCAYANPLTQPSVALRKVLLDTQSELQQSYTRPRSTRTEQRRPSDESRIQIPAPGPLRRGARFSQGGLRLWDMGAHRWVFGGVSVDGLRFSVPLPLCLCIALLRILCPQGIDLSSPRREGGIVTGGNILTYHASK